MSQEADSVDGVEKIFNDAKAEAEKSRKSHSTLKEFKKKLDAVLGGANNLSVTSVDMDSTECTFNDIDPITKKKIVHPVMNSICGHIYDKTSILEAISLNKRMRCPVVGCGNNKHVTPGHIIDDPAKIQQIRLSQQENIDITL